MLGRDLEGLATQWRARSLMGRKAPFRGEQNTPENATQPQTQVIDSSQCFVFSGALCSPLKGAPKHTRKCNTLEIADSGNLCFRLCCVFWCALAPANPCPSLIFCSYQGIRKTQEGCGGLRGENPGVFPKAGPIFQQPFSLPENATLPENAQTLAGIASRAAGR